MNFTVMKATRFGPLLFFLFFLASCGSDRLDVDVSEITVDPVKIKRFDKDFFAMDTSKLDTELDKLRGTYGTFTDAFVNNIVCFNSHDSLSCFYALGDFLTHHITRGAWENSCKTLGDDFSSVENDLTDAYKHFLFYFPDRELPKDVYLVMAGFNYNYIQSEGVYAIGMEYFLGKDNVYYDGLEWPMYKRRTLSREYMASGFVRSWMMNEFPYSSEKSDVVNRIVYEGKILYLQKALLRNSPDSIITGFTQQQLDWCEENEAEMWAKMIEDKIVYSESEDDLNHMIQDAPFTPGFPRESPGKAGVWIGLRIVEAYMERFPTTTLQELMDFEDGQLFLTQSKYKPKF
jgi:hypothetical protein